jgi:hypothetical protein
MRTPPDETLLAQLLRLTLVALLLFVLWRALVAFGVA